MADGHSPSDALAAVDSLDVDWESQPLAATLNYWELQDYAKSQVIDRIIWLGGEEPEA